ncbi:MAG TPA: nuclear transport factor 2 family protein [Chloroflexota bacterium]|jgi:hypothetical protein
MNSSTTTVTNLVNAYYASWQHGIATFDEPRLRGMLDPELLFEGPIAGRRVGVDGFLRGLADFVKSLRGLRMLEQVCADTGAASLYECDLGATGGTLRFAEFMTLEGNQIALIKLVYDPVELRRLTS